MLVRRPTAYVFIGPAGSGKSTAARAAAAQLRAPYLDKDTMVTPLTELLLRGQGEDPLQRESSEWYRSTVFPAEYEALMRTAGDNLTLGMDVVLDAPFFAVLEDGDYLERARTLARWPECDVVVVTVRTSEALLRRRLVDRGYARDRWKLEHWDEFWAMMRAIRCSWRGARLVDLANDGDRLDEAALAVALDLPPAAS